MYIGKNEVQIFEKGNLDHSEMDKSYFMKKMKNEGETVEVQEELRESKKRLRDFEANIDNELPVLERLKDFKSLA
jgi:hypothetical protein